MSIPEAAKTDVIGRKPDDTNEVTVEKFVTSEPTEGVQSEKKQSQTKDADISQPGQMALANIWKTATNLKWKTKTGVRDVVTNDVNSSVASIMPSVSHVGISRTDVSEIAARLSAHDPKQVKNLHEKEALAKLRKLRQSKLEGLFGAQSEISLNAMTKSSLTMSSVMSKSSLLTSASMSSQKSPVAKKKPKSRFTRKEILAKAKDEQLLRTGLKINVLGKEYRKNRVVKAFMEFLNPIKRQRDFLIPKDRAAWLEFLVQLARRKMKIQYLSNKELKKVIVRARPNLGTKKQAYINDPDCPECFFWNQEELGEWLGSIGYPNLKETFKLNCIDGRRLVTVDINALRQMGMKYFDEMKFVASKIRELLGLTRPNILRAIMRMVPFEMYLKKRVRNGKTYDLLTFEKFCKINGFDYNALKTNKNALIPCTTEVYVVPTGIVDEEAENESDEEDELSILNAPTVEFVVRNSVVRNKIVTRIIEELLKLTIDESNRRPKIAEALKAALELGYDELGFDKEYNSKERLEFATSVAQALIREMKVTAMILEDIDDLEKYVGESVSPEKKQYLKEVTQDFMEDVLPLAAAVAFGQLDLETIFKQTPEFEELIDDVIQRAQRTLQNEEEDAQFLVTEAYREAYKGLRKRAYNQQGLELYSTSKEIVAEFLEDLLGFVSIITRCNLSEFVYEDQEKDLSVVTSEMSF